MASTPPATSPTATSPTASAPATPPAAATTTTTPATPAPASPPAAATTAPAGQTLPTALPTVAITEPRAGFHIAYPRAWARLTSKDPSVSLLLASRGDGVSLLVRAVKLAQPINGPRLAVLRDETGRLIRARPGVQLIAGPRLLQTASLPGFLYIYSFPDPITKERAGHSQITLYAGRRMYTLVFQTARAADLPRFAMLFDKITASFGAI